ncbi:replication associated protein [Lake Sarah-associated circular virus-49]|uniref:replication associated protein n=1 Tax=Lake Sarah-associated circular virus-49 TaxID=1685778 RepID=UPI0007778A43|nr:replication associated protein [Lake Sarah-associated circular virus-49]ALE29807.1 replication associated protein [Lake Sarah-associated circular virus-49]ALE29813.1 replication associated protein [Lake Sarah-associated circular virus-49]
MSNAQRSGRTQGHWFIGTCRDLDWDGRDHPQFISYGKGQLELSESGFRHWQFVVQCKDSTRIAKLKKWLPTCHWELTRSESAIDYVWKEETRIEGSQFEFGVRRLRRNAATDWDVIKQRVLAGSVTSDDIPADIFVRYYSQLKYNPFYYRSIAKDYSRPAAIIRSCVVYWGPTGTGKSRRAWSEATTAAYVKDPLSKWWEGYQGEISVIIDEFRGIIQPAHLLRWLDRYPVSVECKGGSTPLRAQRFWICSNLHPSQWYPELDGATYSALERRMEIVEMAENWEPIESEELIEVSE